MPIQNDPAPIAAAAEERLLERERWDLLRELDEWLELPMVVLGFTWLALLVVELIWGLAPMLQLLVNVIWGLFIVDFALKFALAPDKPRFLRRNWLTLVSLAIPALRVVRVAGIMRFFVAARGVRLVRVITSLNRGVKSLRLAMDRRGIGYVVALTAVVTLTGAAGMFAFERGAGSGISSFGSALWWTAMLMTTLGSESWPQTAEGRMLGFLLALYAVSVFGYITASLASYFIGRDMQASPRLVDETLPTFMSGAEQNAGEPPASSAELSALRAEIAALRRELRTQSSRA